MTPAETWVALVHHPVHDKHGKIVATALTNLDLHDIARSTRTYGLAGFLIVHPVEAQRELARRIASHWLKEGAELNDFRRMAIERIHVVESLAAARSHVELVTGRSPTLIATSARPLPGAIGCRALVRSLEGPAIVVLGTGWGLAEGALAACPSRLLPISGPTEYNHLSVRSACAILLDRLYGDREN